MRLTACDVCKKTHPDSAPIGWIAVGLITAATHPLPNPFGFAMADKGYETMNFLVCSTECLSAFAEMESLKAVT